MTELNNDRTSNWPHTFSIWPLQWEKGRTSGYLTHITTTGLIYSNNYIKYLKTENYNPHTTVYNSVPCTRGNPLNFKKKNELVCFKSVYNTTQTAYPRHKCELLSVQWGYRVISLSASFHSKLILSSALDGSGQLHALVKFTMGKDPWILLGRKLNGPQKQFWCFLRDTTFLLETEPHFIIQPSLLTGTILP